MLVRRAAGTTITLPSPAPWVRSPELVERWRLLRADRWLVVVDVVLVGLAYVLALLLRFDYRVPAGYWRTFPAFLGLALVVYLASHAWTRVYGAVWLQAGPAEVWKLVVSSAGATALLVAADAALATPRPVPLSLPLNAGALALLLFAGVRFRARVLTGRSGATDAGSRTRVLLVGPLAAARAVVAQMASDEEAGYLPVAVVTDEEKAWGRDLSGVPVLGPVHDLPALADRYDAALLLLVYGSARRDQVAGVMDQVKGSRLVVKTLPTLQETMGRRAGLQDIRDVSIADLLGREQVQIDDGPVRRTITGKRVLITGAGGSIGSEIAVQVARLDPALLVLLDHDETHLHDVVSRIDGPARSVLGDVREHRFVDALFDETRPEVVFHAAAHKHVPVLEHFPSEAVRTNVLGTRVLVTAATRYGTERFVAISTDKAVSPSSVMGASKRLAEQLVQHLRPSDRRFCCVRFGNVLGSRGSVVPTFIRQVREGGPVTVTHPDVERFFMTTEEAVQLVLQAGARAEGGEVFMLDMGQPVRIVELAERIISLADLPQDREVQIVFTGLRPGEKLSEELHSEAEDVRPTSHPKIHLVRGPVPPAELFFAALEELAGRAVDRDEAGTKKLLLELARTPGELQLDGELLQVVRRAEAPRAGRSPLPRARGPRAVGVAR